MELFSDHSLCFLAVEFIDVIGKVLRDYIGMKHFCSIDNKC